VSDMAQDLGILLRALAVGGLTHTCDRDGRGYAGFSCALLLGEDV